MLKHNHNVIREFAPIEQRADRTGHPRPRKGKTAREHAANPNKERDRKNRQWERAVESARWCNTYRHK